MSDHELDVSTLEAWLWDAACQIRGEIDAPKYKDYILPLIFLKRLSDMFEDEVAALGTEFGDPELAARSVEKDHELVRFYIPELARWPAIAKVTVGLGQHLTEAVRAVSRENPRLQGVIDIVDYNATAAGQRIINDDRLASLAQVLGRHRLGLRDVEPDILGRAYEYLLRKFAEGQGQSAGEFYTPREVAILMARLLDPQPGEAIYDPACGSGGLLIKTHQRLLETHGVMENGSRRLPGDLAPLQLFGQELNHTTYAMAKMNAFIHDTEAEIKLGDTMARPAFLDDAGGLHAFDKVTANPMWNQDFAKATYENDAYGRFALGVSPSSSADWGWVQHMLASLGEGGKGAVVLDTGAVSRGGGAKGRNRERDIRKRFVDEEKIEAVLLLPENLFYNTTAPGIIMVFRNGGNPHPGEILLINASDRFAKGRPKNYLTDENIKEIAAVYHEWRPEEEFSAVIAAADVARNDYKLSPSRYVAKDDGEEVLPLEEALVLLAEAGEERAAADDELEKALKQLGWRGGGTMAEVNDLPPGFKMTEIGLLPEEWGVGQLGDVCNLVKEKVHPRQIADEPYVGLGHLDSHDARLKRWGSSRDVRSSKGLFSQGDVIYGKLRPYLAKAALAEFGGVCSTDILILRARQGSILPEILVSLLHTGVFVQHAINTTVGTNLPRTRWSSLREFKLPIPPPSEQQAIARVLSAIDATEAVIEAAQALKKSLMQHLFIYGPVPVDQADQVPLKETEIGLVPEGWEVVRLGDIAKVGNGSTPKRSNPSYWQNGTIPWLTSGKVHERIIHHADQFITDIAREQCHLPFVRRRSILVAITGQGKTLGNAALVTFDTCVSQHLVFLQIESPQVIPEFILAYLGKQYQDLRRLSSSGGSTKGALTCSLLRTYLVPKPSMSEQRRLADTIDTVDQKLHGETDRKSALEAFFRSLLHHLMTGQVRVPIP